MTLPLVEACPCACCGKLVVADGVASTNERGHRDLDHRPAEMLRSTIPYWVIRCPHCGYCANRVDQCDERSKEIVASEPYQALLKDEGYPAKASEFRCQAYLDSCAGRRREEFWALVHAAWVCDDERCSAQAAQCRRFAVRVGLELRRSRQPLFGVNAEDPPGLTESVLVDLMRRAGDTDEALGMVDAALAKASSAQLLAVLKYQRDLLGRRDMAGHSFAEVAPDALGDDRQAPPEQIADAAVEAPVEPDCPPQNIGNAAELELKRIELFVPGEDMAEPVKVRFVAADTVRIEETPAFIETLAIQDTVKVRALPDGRYEFLELLEKGNWHPLTFIVPPGWIGSPGSKPFFKRAAEMSAICESLYDNVLMVSLPPGTRAETISELEALLNDGLAGAAPSPVGPRGTAPDPLGKPLAGARPDSDEGGAANHRRAVADFDGGRDAFAAGKYERAERLLRSAAELFGAQDPGGDWHFTAWNELGVVLKKVGRLKEAAECYRKAHEHFMARHGLDRADTVVTMHNLGATLLELGDVETGFALLTRALDLQLSKGHTKPLDVAHNYETLSGACKARGDLDHAIEFRKKAIELRERLVPSDQAGVADACAHLCELMTLRGDATASESYARKMIASREAALGRFHRDTADACNQLGVALSAARRYAEAEAAFRDALGRLEESAGRGDLFVVNARTNLADVLLQQGKTAAAEAAARDALRTAEHALGPEHKKTVRALEILGEVLRQDDRAAEAVPLLARARRTRRTFEGGDDADYGRVVNGLGLALYACDAHEEAERLFAEAHGIFMRCLGPWHEDACTAQVNRARALLKLGERERAERLLSDVVAAGDGEDGAGLNSVAYAAFELGEALAARRDLGGAQAACQRALGNYVQVYGRYSWPVARCCDVLVGVFRAGGARGDAALYANRAHEIRVAMHGIDHPYALTTLKTLVTVADERDPDRGLAVARRWYDEAARAASLSDEARGVFESVLGAQLIRCGQKEEGASHLERGLAAHLRHWARDPNPALELASPFADACMSVGRYELIVRALRVVLARCEETDAVAESWAAALRVHIANVLCFTGRHAEAATDARLAWAYYRSSHGHAPWALAEPWVLYWLTMDSPSRAALAPWVCVLPKVEAGGMAVLRIRFCDGDEDVVEQVLLSFHFQSPDALRIRSVSLPHGAWLCPQGAGDIRAPTRVWASADSLLDVPQDLVLTEPPFDPGQPVAAFELCGKHLAVGIEPGAPMAMLRLQSDIVHALMRFKAVNISGWNYAVQIGGREVPGPHGVDADDFFETVAKSSRQ